MGLLELLANHQVLIIAIVALAGCCYFLYKFWNKSKQEMDTLKRQNLDLQRQLKHGYLVETADELNSNDPPAEDYDEEHEGHEDEGHDDEGHEDEGHEEHEGHDEEHEGHEEEHAGHEEEHAGPTTTQQIMQLLHFHKKQGHDHKPSIQRPMEITQLSREHIPRPTVADAEYESDEYDIGSDGAVYPQQHVVNALKQLKIASDVMFIGAIDIPGAIDNPGAEEDVVFEELDEHADRPMDQSSIHISNVLSPVSKAPSKIKVTLKSNAVDDKIHDDIARMDKENDAARIKVQIKARN